MKEIFIESINEKKQISITFKSKEKGIITRQCIPFDYGPWRRKLVDNPDRFHMYDLNSPDGKHNLSILPDQIISIEKTEVVFDPKDYINWTPNWFVSRNWGKFS